MTKMGTTTDAAPTPEKNPIKSAPARRRQKMNSQEAHEHLPQLKAFPLQRNYPLSFQQQSMWLLPQIAPGSPLLNLCFSMRLHGMLKVNVLQKTLKEIIKRHSMLRTSFAVINDEPRQVISDLDGFEPAVDDISLSAEGNGESKTKILSQQEAISPFDLNAGPLIRFKLIKFNALDHILVFNIHHIISDAVSIQVIRKELITLYNGYTRGEKPALPQIKLQYHDYTVWQQKLVNKGHLVHQERYWLKELSGKLPVLHLPTDYSRQPLQSFRGSVYRRVLDRELRKRLTTFSFRNMVPLFSTLLSAFYVLLYKCTGQTEVMVGINFAGRHHSSDLLNIIGFFANTLPLRVDLSGNPMFRELLSQVQKKVIGAYDNQNYPLQRLIKKINPERDTSRAPLFQVMFDMKSMPTEKITWEGLKEKEWTQVDTMTSQYDLMIYITDNTTDLEIKFVYFIDLFEESTIILMAKYFIEILRQVSMNKNAKLDKIKLSHDYAAMPNILEDDQGDYKF